MLPHKVAVNVILVLIISSTGESYWHLKAAAICPDGNFCPQTCCKWRASATGWGCCNRNHAVCCTRAMDGMCCPRHWRCSPPHHCVPIGNQLGRGYRAKDVEYKGPENLL